MIRTITAAVALALAITAGPALATGKQCRDAKGKFVKCPPAAASTVKPNRCKDAKGKFAKCRTPGARPASL